MNILFLGDYSGYHATLAKSLRKMGHRCVVASSGSRCMDTERDINIVRQPGFINSFRYLGRLLNLLPQFKGYDVVQIINPGFFHLKPDKLKFFLDKIKKNNKIMCLTLAGSDSLFIREMLEGNSLRYSEFKIGNTLTDYSINNQNTINQWLNENLVKYCKYVYDNVDGAVSALYEYHVAANKFFTSKPLIYGGIPIDTESIAFTPLGNLKNRRLNIMAAFKSEYFHFKGADRLLSAAIEVERRNAAKCKVDVVKDLSLVEYLEKMQKSDIVLDQLYSYTPATNALQALAMGKIAVTGAEKEFYEFIAEDRLHPMINAVPNDEKLVETLENLINLPEKVLLEKSFAGREYVMKHNSAEVVAERFLNAWKEMI